SPRWTRTTTWKSWAILRSFMRDGVIARSVFVLHRQARNLTERALVARQPSPSPDADESHHHQHDEHAGNVAPDRIHGAPACVAGVEAAGGCGSFLMPSP